MANFLVYFSGQWVPTTFVSGESGRGLLGFSSRADFWSAENKLENELESKTYSCNMMGKTPKTKQTNMECYIVINSLYLLTQSQKWPLLLFLMLSSMPNKPVQKGLFQRTQNGFILKLFCSSAGWSSLESWCYFEDLDFKRFGIYFVL